MSSGTMREIEVSTKAELEAAIKDGHIAVCIAGSLSLTTNGNESPTLIVKAGCELRVVARESSQPHVVAWGSSQPHVVAWGSSQPHVEAWESSQPHVEAWGSSQPHVEARESSQPRVEAWESSQPRVEARGYVQISLKGRVIATLSQFVSALIHGALPEVSGGHQIKVDHSTPEKWCEYHGVEVKDGVAIVYKAVNEDYVSPHGIRYAPGTVPVAPDWDGGKEECGGGLHYSPSPSMALAFNYDAKHFVACPVALQDIAVHPDGQYPEKIKARGCCAPVWEVDEDGERKN